MKGKPDFAEIAEDFDVYGIQLGESEEVLKKCQILCETHELNSEQIAVHWLGYAASHSYDDVTLEKLEAFERDVLRKKKTQPKDEEDSPQKEDFIVPKKSLSTDDDDLLATYGASPSVSKVPNVATTPQQSSAKRSFAFSQSLEDIKSSPLAPSLSQSPSAQQSQKYSQRTNAGAVVASFGSDLDSAKWKADLSFSPKVKEVACGSENSLSSPYSFMFEKLRDSAEILDDTIFNMGTQLREHLNIEDSSHIGSLNNEPVWCIGRIICDSVGRLNAASLMLEGDRDVSAGSTVKLDVSRLPSYSLFPGQIIAVKGINTTGDCLIANEVVNGKILPIPNTDSSIGKEGMHLKVACGPFTTLDNLLYEPLMDLLEDVVLNPPHVLLLLGPLVDSSHPLLLDPLLSDSYDSILERCIEKIDSALQSTPTQVYVVCSQRDICCLSIYPTPPAFISGSITGNTKIKLLPDPSLLDIEGVLIGMTTIDYPMLISREEINYFPERTDRLARLSQHLLLQQSFFPIYPPPEGMAVNYEHMDLHTRLPLTPHVMITPSDLKGYVKTVEGCIFINPEKLTKGRSGGSYCGIFVKPGMQKEKEFNVQIRKV